MRSASVRLVLALRVITRVYGFRLAPGMAATAYVLLRSLVSVGRRLDPLIFRRLSKTKLQRPIVLAGNPRTGSTFLHRFLCDIGVGAGLPLHRMIFGSLVLQSLAAPLLPAIERRGVTNLYDPLIHKTGLREIEADDAAILFGSFDGFLLFSLAFAHAGERYIQSFEHRYRDTADRDFNWLAELWKRNLVSSNSQRVVAKLFSLGHRLPAFFRQFPDARVIYMARDPVEAIPSAISLSVSIQDRSLRFSSLPQQLQSRYIDGLYEALVLQLRRFHEDWASGAIPQDKVYVVRYDRLTTDFERVVEDILKFVDHEPSPEARRMIEAQATKQTSFRSQHRFTLGQFGLDASKVRRDCDFFYRTFLPSL